MPAATIDEVVALCKRRGLIFPASEIYGGIANTYDYGHYGVLLKRNVIGRVVEGDDPGARRHRRAGLGDHPAPAHVGGLRAPRGLHATRSSQCLGKCKRRFRAGPPPGGGRGPRRGSGDGQVPGVRRRPDRAARVQPDVPDDDRPGAGGRLDRLPAPRDRAGHLPRLQDDARATRARSRRSASRRSASRSATRSRPANFIFRTLEFEQMEMEFFVPPDEAQQWYEYWCAGAPGLVHAARHPARAPAPAPARPGGALALLRPGPATSSTCTRSAGRELEGVANRGNFDLTPALRVLAARSSSRRTRRPARATSRT